MMSNNTPSAFTGDTRTSPASHNNTRNPADAGIARGVALFPSGNESHSNEAAISKALQSAKRKTYSTTDTVKIWKSVFGSSMEGVCKMCSETYITLETRTGTDAWEISHIIPFSEGGSDDLPNLRPLCRTCNRSMGKRQFKAFAFESYPERFDEIVDAFNLE